MTAVAAAAAAAVAAVHDGVKAGPVATSDAVEVLPSIFPHRPATIFFELPKGLPPRGCGQLMHPAPVHVPFDHPVLRAHAAALGYDVLRRCGVCLLCMRLEKNANSVRHAFKRAGTQ